MMESLRFVTMKKRLVLRRGSPDVLAEELISALSTESAFEFKPLFTVVYGSLQARNAAHGGEPGINHLLCKRLSARVRESR